MAKQKIKLKWHRYERFTNARKKFPKISCVYVQTDRRGMPIRVGKTLPGLSARYHGGTGYAIDAAMHGSKNLFFVAQVSAGLCDVIERELIWQGRNVLHYNNQGKLKPPHKRVSLHHYGQVPVFDKFEIEL